MYQYKKILDIFAGYFFWVLFLSATFISFFLISDSAWIFNILIIPALLFGYNKRDLLTQPQQKFLKSLAAAVIFTYALRIGLHVYKNILNPPQWDFYLYWIYGQAGARLLNPYEPANLLQFAQNLNPTESFFSELYFFQIPPLIFLFIPLGWFEIHTAAFLWYIFLLIILTIDILVLWQILGHGTKYEHLLLVASLTLVLASVFQTLSHAQINFLVLLAFLLYWKNRESLTGGIWLGLGIIVKPILVIVLIYPILRRSWRSLLGTGVGILVSSAFTILIFGPGMFFGYFTDNPIVSEMPNYLFTEEVNQSLLATILRLTNFDFGNGSPYLQPIFVFAALSLSAITLFLIFFRKDDDKLYSDFALALTLTYALLIFPKTLNHYAVLLIVPILVIWENREDIGINPWLIFMFITVEYVLVSLEGNFVFISFLIAWLVLAGICTTLLLHPPQKSLAY